MFLRYILSSVLFILVHAQQIKFSDNEVILFECIKYHLKEDLNFFGRKDIENIAHTSANHFRQKVLNNGQFTKKKSYLFDVIKKSNPHLFAYSPVTTKLVRKVLMEALMNCIERQNLPRFENEPKELAEFLDYILVDWPTSLYYMINSQKGRSTLRAYAYGLGRRLMSALGSFSMDYEVFGRKLREAWMSRAQKLYDGRSSRSYLRHRFTTNSDRFHIETRLGEIHTTDYVNSFVPRRYQNFSSRNPSVTSSSAYQPDVNLKSAQYYLESHIAQSYRILFFILELQVIGIVTDKDDTYDGPVPEYLLSDYSPEMVYYDRAYINYLLFLRNRLKALSDCFQCCSEEHMIVLLVQWIKMKRSVSTTTSTMSTTAIISSTTSSYQEGLEKGGIREKDWGKYFPPKKRLKMMFFEQNQQSESQNNPGANHVLKQKNSFCNFDPEKLMPQNYLDIDNVFGQQINFFNFDFEESSVFMSIVDKMVIHSEL